MCVCVCVCWGGGGGGWKDKNGGAGALTRKMVPNTGRARSFLVYWSFQEEGRQYNRLINLPNVITFSMDYKYTT